MVVVILVSHAASGALPPLTPARGARAGARCFSWYYWLAHGVCGCFFCCLSFSFFSLRRGLAFCARFGGVGRFSAVRRLLPLWFSLCFPLRGVGWLIALRLSSPFFRAFFIDVWAFFLDVWGFFIDIKVCFFLHFSDFFRNFAV